MDAIGLDGVLYALAAAGSLLACLAYAGSVRTIEMCRSARPFEILSPDAAALPHDVEDSTGAKTARPG